MRFRAVGVLALVTVVLAASAAQAHPLDNPYDDTVFARIEDRPGSLVRLLGVFAAAGANLVEVQHQREGLDLHVRQTGVHATFEVRSREHAATVLDAVRRAGYQDLRAES